MRDARCVAFTYVNPNVQGPNARCWLKNAVPNPVANPCCTSGVKGERGGGAWGAPPPPPPPAPMGPGFEQNVDRPGSDFQNFDLPEPNPALCRDYCLRNGLCRAFTYVPGSFFPAACFTALNSSAARVSSGSQRSASAKYRSANFRSPWRACNSPSFSVAAAWNAGSRCAISKLASALRSSPFPSYARPR